MPIDFVQTISTQSWQVSMTISFLQTSSILSISFKVSMRIDFLQTTSTFVYKFKCPYISSKPPGDHCAQVSETTKFLQTTKSPVHQSIYDHQSNSPSGHQIIIRPSDHQTTRPSDHQPPDHQTTRPSDHQTIRPSDHQTIRLPSDWQTTSFPPIVRTQGVRRQHSIVYVNTY